MKAFQLCKFCFTTFTTHTANTRRTLATAVMKHSSTFLLPTTTSTSTRISPTDQIGSPLTYALILLNQPLPKFTPLLWNQAQLRLCADGGANRLFDEMPQLVHHENESDVRNRYKPDVIKGDLDSIRDEVKEFYEEKGTEIIDMREDQDTSDLHKCVAYVRDSPSLDKSNLCILVAGALGGRFDHEIGNINVLYKFPTLRIILISDDCLIQRLPNSHSHEIHIQSSVEGPHCGLIPVGAPSTSTTTTGLRWNLPGDWEMKFGGLVSTSNIVDGEIITVRSDTDLLWTISIKKENVAALTVT